MKKVLILCFGLVFLNLSAQLNLKVGVIKSQLKYNNLTGQDIYNSSVDPLIIGAYYEQSMLNVLGLEVGCQFHGLKEKSSFGSFDINNYYFSIPVALKYRPKSLFSPGIGIQAATLMNSSIDITKNFDLSAFLKLNINPINKIGLELGYNLGFVPILDMTITNDLGATIVNGNFKNRYWFLMLRYKV